MAEAALAIISPPAAAGDSAALPEDNGGLPPVSYLRRLTVEQRDCERRSAEGFFGVGVVKSIVYTIGCADRENTAVLVADIVSA
jgi:hypothetical protein